jgi:L-threonylcarbamoyladenylate synthase
VSPTSAEHVLQDLAGRIDAVLDTGPSAVGLESTILGFNNGRPTLLRPGGIALAEIEAAVGPVDIPRAHGGSPVAPGQLASHYAPSLPVRLEARSVGANEALLAFGTPLPGAAVVWNLSPAGNLREAAARLFEGLRVLDAEGRRRGLGAIAAMTVPEEGVGTAINDRLRRAAAPRPVPG